jgi:hypothetical protein
MESSDSLINGVAKFSKVEMGSELLTERVLGVIDEGRRVAT